MEKILVNRIRKEILIFLFLSVVNIVFSAITLAAGIVFIVNHLPTVLNDPSLGISFFYLLAGFPLVVIGLFWIIYSVGLMDFITDKQFEFIKKNSEDPEELTSIIISMLSFYRENSVKIRRMIVISRLGGTFFIFNGLISIVNIYTNYSSFSSIQTMQFFAIILVFVWGMASLAIPVFVNRFSYIWDLRVEESKKAEEKIELLMERR